MAPPTGTLHTISTRRPRCAHRGPPRLGGMPEEPPETPPPPTVEATLLVVEDDATINQAVTDRLVAEGFRVIQAYDGPDAVAAELAHTPDLVVLDLMLPGFD